MRGNQQQSGFALLLFMVVVIGFIIAGFSGVLTTSVQQQNEQKRLKNMKVLNQAKEALLSYAVNYLVDNQPENMGALPCPDAGSILTEGNQDTNCGAIGINSIGFFPFKSVDLGKIEDTSGECLWYIVSGNYKNAPGYNLRNWDSSGGFLKLVDENGNLQHKDNSDDYPVALIISPGPSLNQNRSPDLVNLPECRASYDRLKYLEGGPNLDYSIGSTDLPVVKDAIWTILTSSIESGLKNTQYNDQVVAIYKNDIWDRVKKTRDLDTTNTASNIRQLTRNLAECLKLYGTDTDTSDGTLANTKFNLPYPADIQLANYTETNLYTDNASGLLYGRFPQDITNSETVDDIITQDTHFVRSYGGVSFCESVIPDFNEELWNHWKDHFFYVLANDFEPGVTPALASKCGAPGDCLSITENGKTVAAIVFFAEEGSSSGQDRALSGLAAATDKDLYIWEQYLDNDPVVAGSNQMFYLGTDATNDYSIDENDYAYCVVKSSTTLGIEEC